MAECSAAQKTRGWRVVGASCVTTAGVTKHGKSAGVFIAVPRPVALKMALDQTSWDISPAGSPGRACMALMQVKGGTWIMAFSLYLWTGQALTATGNALLLEEVVKWIVKLRIVWIAGADWQNEPQELERSPWNEAVRGVVRAPAEGTCRSKGTERTIDFFWMDRRLAATSTEAEVYKTAPFSPHKPVSMTTKMKWNSYRVRALWQPQQFPLDRPVGPSQKPSAYPDVDLRGDKGHLDEVYTGFCTGAEAELNNMFGHTGEVAKRHAGRGQPPVFKWKALIPPMPAGCATAGAARAWRWMAQQVAWMGVLYCKWLTNPGDRASHEPQMVAAWEQVLADHEHWEHLACWRSFVWNSLQGIWQWKGITLSLIQWMGELQSWMSAAAEELERQLMRRREQEFRERLDDKFPGSGGFLFRICKWRNAWQPRKGSVSKQPLPADPHEAVQQEETDWRQVWQLAQQQETPLWRTCPRTLREEMPAILGEKLRPICAAYKRRAGLGGCAWHPRHWSWLSEEALHCLGQMLMLCERLGAWPTAIRFLLLMLVDKEDGGGRPVALQCSVQRVWEGAREPQFLEWDRKFIRDYDFAGKGKAGHKAVWQSMLEDEAFEHTGIVSTTLLTDLAKAYEKVHLNLLWLLGVAMHMPLVALMLALENYYGIRYIRIEEACSEGTQTIVGLIAGSKFANRFLKLVLLLPIDWILDKWRRMKAVVFVDDVKLKWLGTPREALAVVPAATRMLIYWLEQIMKLKVSLDTEEEKGKSGFLCSCPDTAAGLLPLLQEQGLHQETSKKWLGIDYQPGAKRTQQPTRLKRLAVARSRWLRVQQHQRKYGRAGKVIKQGHVAAVAYGANCLGSPQAVVEYVKAKTRATQAGAGAFRSSRLAEALNGAKELARLVVAPIKAYAEEAWEATQRATGEIRELDAGVQAKAWHKQVPGLRLLAARGIEAAWKGVKGPAGACWTAVTELGGQMPSPFLVQKGVHKWDLRQVCPLEVALAMEEAQGENTLRAWTKEEGRETLQPMPWLQPARQLLNRKITARWTRQHRAAVRMAVTGGYPEQQELFQKDRVDSEECPLCLQEPGTLQHLYWRCAHPECQRIRQELAPSEQQGRDKNFSDVVHRGSVAQEEPWKWTRGLVADPLHGYHWGVGEETIHMEGAGQLVSGRAVLDGSLMHATFPQLRAGGWAIINGLGDQQTIYYGSVPVANPTSLAAELWAVLMCLRLAGENLLEIVTDCAAVVRGMQRGRSWATSSARPQAHIWVLIWDRLEALELVPEVNLQVSKVKAHKTAEAKRRLEEAASRGLHQTGTAEARQALQLTYLNELADKWAKKGARMAGPPSFKVQEAKEKAAECKTILEYVAHFRVGLQGLKTTTWEPARGRGARQALREARRLRLERLRHRREQGGRQHSFEVIGSMSVCRKCNRRAHTAASRRALEMQACDPAAHRLNQRAREKARRQEKRQGAEVKEEVLDAIAPVGPHGHRLAQLGKLTFCTSCSCYTEHVGRGLLEECKGRPLSNSNADRSRRCTRKLLMAGKHPGTRKQVEGGSQDQLDVLLQWSQAEEAAARRRQVLSKGEEQKAAIPSAPEASRSETTGDIPGRPGGTEAITAGGRGEAGGTASGIEFGGGCRPAATAVTGSGTDRALLGVAQRASTPGQLGVAGGDADSVGADAGGQVGVGQAARESLHSGEGSSSSSSSGWRIMGPGSHFWILQGVESKNGCHAAERQNPTP